MKPSSKSVLPSWSLPFIGRHTGILREVVSAPHTPEDAGLYYGAAVVADTGILTGEGRWSPPTGGVGTSPEAAVQSAIGEAFERYCAAFPLAAVEVESYHRLAKRGAAIQPSRLSGFSKEQLRRFGVPFVDVDTQPLRWYRAKTLTGERDVYVPAAWVTLPYHGTDYRTVGNTTGLACQKTWEDAAFNAVMEVIERDAYVQTWLFKGRPPRVAIAHTDFWKALAPVVPVRPEQMTVYDLTGTLPVPVFLVALRMPRYGAQKGEPDTWYCHGVAAHLDGKIAVQKAVFEACLTVNYLEQLRYTRPDAWRADSELSTVSDFEAHAIFYNAAARRRRHLSFIDEGPLIDWADAPGAKLVSFDGEDKLSTTARLLGDAGIQSAVIDLTTADIRPSGLRAARALIEGFAWLHGDHLRPFLGTPRMRAPHLYYPFIKPPKDSVENCTNPWPHALA
jgi:ribosomal protein S12 methylthiotransferase accessory factor